MQKSLSTPFRGWKADALYFTDNGCVLCGNDLGSSAKYSGRDISGQKIAKVTPEDAAESLRLYPNLGPICCESCGKVASILHLPA